MKLSVLSALVVRAVVPAALMVLLSCPSDLFAQAVSQDHIVSSQTLQQQIETSSATRQRDIATLTTFMSTPIAERTMRDARIDPVQVQKAIPTLSDRELANLSTRAADAQQKFSAGVLGIGLLSLIILVLAVIIIVAIVH